MKINSKAIILLGLAAWSTQPISAARLAAEQPLLDRVARADPAYGAYLAGECLACHAAGADAAIPSLDAMPPDEFVEALRQYREGERDHELMRNVARTLGQAEIEALAAYFGERGD